MSEQTGPAPRVAVGPGAGGIESGYTPLVPTRSPFTGDAAGAVRVAWRVTLGALVVLLAVLTGVPLGRNWYVNAAMEPREGRTRPIDGVVFVRRQGVGDWLAAGADERIVPGDVLRTAQDARAFVTLFDGSTVLLYPSSTLRVLRAEQGRFRPERRSVIVELSGGRARIGVATAPDPTATFFQLRTPQAEVHLEEGSYSTEVTKEGSQVSTRGGLATAHTPNGSVAARSGQRLAAPAGASPTGPDPLRRDLLGNGFFRDRAGAQAAQWAGHIFAEQPQQAEISLDSRPGAVTFRRVGTAHAEALLAQQLDVDLWDFERVTLVAELRVIGHTLPGGGWLGTEYPLMLRVTYKDAAGATVPWYRGYYLHNREGFLVRSESGSGEQLGSSDWQRVEFNLLELVPRPWRIQKVEVLAQGHDFESAVREVRILAE